MPVAIATGGHLVMKSAGTSRGWFMALDGTVSVAIGHIAASKGSGLTRGHGRTLSL